MVEPKQPIQFQSTEPLTIPPIEKILNTPINEAESTLAKASQRSDDSSSPSKPELEKPKSTSAIPHLLEQFTRLEEVGDALEQRITDDVDVHICEMEELYNEHIRVMKESFENSKKVDQMNFFTDLAGMAMAGVSSVVGASMVATNAPILGSMLIAGGIFSITNTTLKLTGNWNWIAEQIAGENEELKTQITTYAPAAMGIIATVLGLSGTFGAYFYSDLSNINQLLLALQTATSLVQGVTAAASGYANAQAYWTNAQTLVLQTKLKVRKVELESAMDDLYQFILSQSDIVKSMKQSLLLTRRGMQIASQVV